MIPLNIPAITGNEEKYIADVLINKKLSGDGNYTKKCNQWFEENFKSNKSLLTTSCTHALEMAAILANIKQDDEVIMPSFTFVSTANAFVLRGAKIIFVDIRPDTMNINEKLIEAAITSKTKAIVPVHYAGVACEMDMILEIANQYNLIVIEDAAQGVMSKYKGKALGAIGDMGCYSFHETKNYNCGEGGSLLINNSNFSERAEIIREKGTDRSKFLRGHVDKYTWVDVGSSYLPSELNAAFLFAQLEFAHIINDHRLSLWNDYYAGLKSLESNGILELPVIPDNCEHNAHMFYLKVKNMDERTDLSHYLKKNDVYSTFHYVPLHSSEAGLKYGQFHGEDKYTTVESERLLRLPLYYSLESAQISKIIDLINNYYN
jgi:dTDP-4-amino-4,6-dideoxygalactose transaminase